MTDLKTVTVAEFLMNVPPYTRCFPDGGSLKALFKGGIRVDGHCPYCGRGTTFNKTAGVVTDTQWSQVIEFWKALEEHHKTSGKHETEELEQQAFNHSLALTCARDDAHKLYFHLRLSGTSLQKVGQYPSFADIAIDESKTFRSVLSTADAREFHKAIGLSSHGVGIGSFVYLRRIFENLIRKRFNEFKAAENWKDEDFLTLRMVEKIQFLRDHLPEFLVRNKNIYGILSRGIHELTEEECLKFFDILKDSTILILQEDKNKKEELAARKKIEMALQTFSPTGGEVT